MATGRSPTLPGRRSRGPRDWSTPREPQPQPPCSSESSPDPFPNGETGVLPPGAEVEVRLDGKGYYGTWFAATVVNFAADRGRPAPPRYSVTFDGDGDISRFAPTHVRPRPPDMEVESPPLFRVHDTVEVSHERGWWSGLVLAAAPRYVTVAFPITREVITYLPRLVRPRCDYVDGDWVPSRAVVAVRPKHEIRRYEVGEEVEVVRERAAYGLSWFPAKVAKVIDDFSYIVKYSDQKGEEEYLHWQFIRPAVQELPPEKEIHLGPGAAVEAICDGAWSAGLVHEIVEDGKFVVRINGKQGKQLMTMAVELLKAQYKWDGKVWSIVSAKRQANNFKQALASCAKRSMRTQQKLALLVQDCENASVPQMGTTLSGLENSLTSICPSNSSSPLYGHSAHQKIVVSDNVSPLSDNLQNQMEKRKKPFIRKVYSSKKRLTKEKEGLEGPSELPSTGQKIGANEIAWSQREPSLVLERSESIKQQLGSTMENAENANQVKYQETVLTFASASDVEDMDVFKVYIKKKMDVLKEFPQKPHFLPLQQQNYPETIQKAMAFGLTVAFDICVEKIRKSSIADDDGSFEEKRSTLAVLKQNGFDVQYVEGLLDKLIKVKDEYSKHLELKSAAQAQQLETTSSISRNDSLLGKIGNGIIELEKRLDHLHQEEQRIEKEKHKDEENLSSLKSEESSIQKLLDSNVEQYNGILAEGQQKRLT